MSDRGHIEHGRAFSWGVVGMHQLSANPVPYDSDSIVRPLPKGGIPEVVRRLKDDAAKVLGPGQPFEIRRQIPTMFGRGHGLAWVSGHWWVAVDADPTELLGDGQNLLDTGQGYYLVEQCWTPV